MKAEEKPNSSNQSVLSGYLQGISSYIPSSIKTTIKKQIYTTTSTIEGEKDTIVSTHFDECEILGQKHKLLNVCYTNGLQIWDLDNPEGVKEIFSLKEGMIRFAKVLATPSEKESPSSMYYGKRPLLAVVSGEDNSKVTRNMVRIYSLKTCEFNLSYLKFQSPVYNIVSNDKIFLVILKEKIVGFNPITMSKVLSLSTFPSVSPMGSVALGPRWIAYTEYQATHSPSSTSSYLHLKSYQQNNQTFGDAAVDVATDLAKEMAQKIYYYGDIGRKKVSSYLYPDDTSPVLSSSPQEQSILDNGCVIIIYDFIKQRQVAVIKPPHSQPISYLTFDPSGTLLFTSSTEGTKINVYQIIPFSNSLSVSPQNHSLDPTHSFRHIYVLKRGITNASIQGISINDTSKWAALTTSRGTTHIYALNPLGGDVNIHTHISKNIKTKPRDYMSEIPNAHPQLQTLTAMDRIKLGNIPAEETGQLKAPSNITAGSSCFLETSSQDLERLFVVNQNGQLVLYELKPQAPTSQDVDPNTLCVQLTPDYEWDVCRRSRSGEYKSSTIPYSEKNSGNQEVLQDTEARWLFNVEITTHSQDIRPIWGNTQFSFRNSSSYKPSPDSLSFFDEDYPIGEVIKIEKKKSNISSPRPDFDDNTVELVNMVDQSKKDEQETETEMELMKQLDQAIKTPLTESLYPQIPRTFEEPPSYNNSLNMSQLHQAPISSSPFGDAFGIPKSLSGFNDASSFGHSPDAPSFAMKSSFNYDEPHGLASNNNNGPTIKGDHSYGNDYGSNDNDLLSMPKITTTTTTSSSSSMAPSYNSSANSYQQQKYPTLPTTYKKTLADLDEPLPPITPSPSIPIPLPRKQYLDPESSATSPTSPTSTTATSPTSPSSKSSTKSTNNKKTTKK
ncbi:hypothetical protein SAMD00019534_075020 [Acytostelium subglobosum LB1]|uniref:hypothetical protein n=1 Tax=Acytostelium subglobosum LB1 TaxID=1410327 RepID=UPI000644DEA6|nr:hypothetical protein SAMD00019534_075020 [Acytostelium subglobosum LB1]GAM24327.1 hypothetical protein SAMD00019534_075020 [Acytostelium subglobosum LB1]|eukprot:XP_012752653.1 hypothetical protein SAMD00019534_075020 [Acytostelium subglobosum LB1]